MKLVLLLAVSVGVVTACGPRAEQITFRSGGVTLSGTVLTPRGRGPFPAVVFVHGDGPDSRNGYRHLAEAFANHGIAALIYDKRGAGESGGRFPARFAVLAADAAAAVRYLGRRPDIDRERVGLWGGSQGGWIAPLAASSPHAGIRFVIVKAGPAVGPAALARWKSVGRVRRAGYSPEVIARVNRVMDLQFEILRSGSGWSRLEEEVQSIRGEPWLPLVAVMRHSSWRSSWMTYGEDIDFNPTEVLTRVDAPILWILGEKDPETPLHETLKALDELKKRGKDITVKVFPGADHQIELPREAPDRPNPAPGYFETMLDWVTAQCSRDKPKQRRVCTSRLRFGPCVSLDS